MQTLVPTLFCIPGGGTVLKSSQPLVQGDRVFFKGRWWLCMSVIRDSGRLRVNVKESQ